jgi:hypothetical protein
MECVKSGTDLAAVISTVKSKASPDTHLIVSLIVIRFKCLIVSLITEPHSNN